MRYVVFAERARPVSSADQVAQVAVSDAPQADRSRLLYQGATNLERALDQSLLGMRYLDRFRSVRFEGNMLYLSR